VAWLLYAATLALVVVGLLASVFHDRALGILVLAFLLAAYTVVRHLAGIELRESGKVVLQGLARPVRRNRTLIAYIAGDLLILNAALLLAHGLLDLQDGGLDIPLKRAWLWAAPVDVVIPFVALLLFRSYSRVWYLARVSEYAATGLAVALGCAVACGVRLLGDAGTSAGWVLYYLLLAGVAAPAIVLTRAALRVVQDLMQWRVRGAGGGAPPARALVCGAGYRTTLFLRQLAFHSRDRTPVDVVGIVSEDAAITGHDVHGIRVLGTCHELPALIRLHRVDTLYLVEPVDEAGLQQIFHLLQQVKLHVIRWDIVETELVARG
jgi:FlaA1/EpsC-like NDP-sugar epimerase